MNISLEQYTGRCSCGKEHKMQTKLALIEPGAVHRLREVLDTLKLTGKGCIVCDRNTEVYADQAITELGGCLCPKEKIVLDPDHLHADEKAVALVNEALPDGVAWLLAVGSGTIHDTTRYVCGEKKLDFLAFPTAASVDGFLSSACAMTWYGFKKTMIGVAPIAVIADSDIFSKAPYHLTAAGIGDVLGKYTSLADWEMAHILIDEPLCPEIVALTREAVDNVMAGLTAIRAGDVAGCEQLMFAQALSGIGMQLWGSSRPASAAEHHLSHLWEMEVINDHIDAYHGEKVGVGLLLCLDAYAKVAAIDDIAAHIRPYNGMPKDCLQKVFGPLYDSMMEENAADLLLEVDTEKLVERFDKVRDILKALPDKETLRAAMEKAGCSTTMVQIGLDPAILQDSLDLSPFVRRRLTTMRLRGLLDV